jgi:hypothetical protein
VFRSRGLHAGTWGVVEYPPSFYDLDVYVGTSGGEKDTACWLDMLVADFGLASLLDGRGEEGGSGKMMCRICAI